MNDDDIRDEIQQARARLDELHSLRAESVRAEKATGASIYSIAKKWEVAERTVRRILDGANG